MEQKLRDIITAHNRVIETIQKAEMTCNLFRGMEVWHKIACEGADIVSAARPIGINATVDMQSGVITVRESCADKVPNVGAVEVCDMLLTEIISSLEEKARDRDGSIDEDDPDCIFRHDAATLRAAAELLRNMRAKL